mmetsp:Transcript_31691/g.74020  ORF Transcript_31691/g.74020 Transcript_31691/m.74020 type:complete len:244 (+) Transcript_31691:2497-3228(+)
MPAVPWEAEHMRRQSLQLASLARQLRRNCCHRMVRTHRRQESQNLLWASQDFRCGVARPPVARTTRHSPPLASFRTLAAHMRHRNRKVTHMRSASPVRRAVLNMTQRKQVGQSEARRKLSAWGLAARRKRMALSREDLASGQKDLWRLAEDRKDLWISVAAVVGQMDLWRWVAAARKGRQAALPQRGSSAALVEQKGWCQAPEPGKTALGKLASLAAQRAPSWATVAHTGVPPAHRMLEAMVP